MRKADNVINIMMSKYMEAQHIINGQMPRLRAQHNNPITVSEIELPVRHKRMRQPRHPPSPPQPAMLMRARGHSRCPCQDGFVTD